MIWREFKALGTDVVITAALPETQQNILLEAEKVVLDFGQRFSRFIPGNELDQFNNAGSWRQNLSPDLIALLQLAQHYYSITGGIFDPTIITNLAALGYNQDFAALSSNPTSSIDLEKLTVNFRVRPQMSDLKIQGTEVSCPENFKVDLGGIGKGYLVDYLDQKLFSTIKNYWISAGGDILVSGQDANKVGWKIGVQNPVQPEQNIFFINTQGRKIGIATSGIIKRAGQIGNFKWHHIIDPRTGLPVENDLLSVTVIAPSTTQADIFAKTVLILGVEAGLKFVDSQANVAGVIFPRQGKPIFSNGFEFYLKDIKNY